MVRPYKYAIDQRVRVKTASGGSHRPPPENAKGAIGSIAPQLTQDWTGTPVAVDPGMPDTYYVTIDGGETELISEEWLEPAPPGSPPAPPSDTRPF